MRNLILAILAGMIIISCDTKKKDMKTDENPFFSEYNTPHEVPDFDRIKTVHYRPAFEKGMEQQNNEIEKIINNQEVPGFENTIVALDKTGILLENVSNVFNNLKSAITSDTLQNIAKEMAPLLSSHRDNIKLNDKLFQRVKAVYENRDKLDLNPEQTMLLEKTYQDFVRSGAELNDAEKKKLRKINRQLSLLALKFGDNVLAETNDFQLVIQNEADLSGLPEYVVHAAAEEASANGLEGKWLFTLQKPSLIPFLQYADNRKLREEIFMAYVNRGDNNNAHDNKKIASKMASLRAKKAQLLGYETHAHYILDKNMAKTPEKVYDLMQQVWDAALPVAKKEAGELQKMIYADEETFDLKPWDWWYYAEKLRKQRYDLDEEALKPFFKLENVKKGMFDVANRLYGLTFKVRDDVPGYHPDAHAYEVIDRDGTHVGILFMDFFPRASKRPGAWMSSFRKQYRLNGENVSPVITMVMNFTKPAGDTPSLLNFDEVSTLFHEFGHALHGLLSECTYRKLSGTSVARDFVELPSQIMENWAAEPDVLKSFAVHYKTGEPIPDELIDKMKASKHFNQGFATVEFTAAAFLDMDWHSITDTIPRDVIEFEQASMEKIGMMPEIVVRYRSPYFAHIFAGGYSAGYYSYQWAEVLDADAFEAFKETSLFDPKTAGAFRENILEKGGTEDPMELYVRFRGKEPGIEPMLRRKGLL